MSHKISAKTEYACIALMELAANQESPELVRVHQIGTRHGVPARFLVQILLQLKSAGIVESTRGASGGYRLKRRPEEIVLGEVMEILEPMPVHKRTTHEKTPAMVLKEVWEAAEVHRQNYLHSVTLADLVKMAKLEPTSTKSAAAR